jgi:hypothetical protein
MRIIDSHTHPFGNPRLRLEGLVKTRRDAVLLRVTHPDIFAQVWDSPEDMTDLLIGDMDRNGIDMTLIQHPPGAERDFFAGALKRHPGRLVGISSVAASIFHTYDKGMSEVKAADPIDQFSALLTYHVRELGFRGVGEGVNYVFSHKIAPDEVAKDLYPAMEIIRDLGVPVMFSTAWNQFGKPAHKGVPNFVDDLAIQFPTVPIILTKMGRGYDFIFEVCLLIAFKNMNVYLDTVQAPAKHIVRAVQEVGADRVLYGSDWDTTWRAMGEHYGGLYPSTLSVIEATGLPQSDKEWILGRTAAELYKL